VAQVLAIIALVAIVLGIIKLTYPRQSMDQAVGTAAKDAGGCLFEGCMEVIIMPLFLFIIVPALWIGAIALVGFLIGVACGVIKF
jgi:hypothetical protein